MSAGRSEYLRNDSSNGRALSLPQYEATVTTNGVHTERRALDNGDEAFAYRLYSSGTKSAGKQPTWKSWVSKSTWSTNGVISEKRWKPMTLRAHMLVPFIISSVGFAIVIEILSRISDRDGGLAFGSSPSNIPLGSQFAYLYLPTIIAVCYSTIWSWIDLDTKRLEPWFQMSREEGAAAKDSLLLHYPSDFLAFVPIRAARQRHWSVFFGGTTMMIVFWAITPLQSAVFGTQPTTYSTSVSVKLPSKLLSPENQTHVLGVNFMNTAYGAVWLGEALPSFTSAEYAILPFEANVGADVSIMAANSSLTSNTTLYETDLSCWPANYSYGLLGYTFDNGQGCVLPSIGLPGSQFAKNTTMIYIGWHNSPFVDYFLESPNCSEQFSHQFLAIWANGLNPLTRKFEKVEGIFCEPSYYKRSVAATVRMGDLSPMKIETTAVREPLFPSEFNTTNFEYIIATGKSPIETEKVTRGDVSVTTDYPDTIMLEQWPRLDSMDLIWPVTNMVGFALGSLNISTHSYENTTNIHRAFESAHKLLFSLAIRTSLSPDSSPASSTGRFFITTTGIYVDRTFAILVEVALGVVALLAASLLFISIRRPSSLICDPASIESIMETVMNSGPLLKKFQGSDLLTDDALKDTFGDVFFRLVVTRTRGTSRMELQTVEDSRTPTDRVVPGIENSSTSRSRNAYYVPVRPLEMRWIAAVPFSIILAFGTGLVIFLRFRQQQLNGLPRPTTNSFLLRALENYLPTVFATLLEPFWVVLNRLLCILLPFDELGKENAKTSRTISAKYTSLPPQLTIWRALRSRHFLLAGVCAVALSANILAVSLSGLFNEDIITIPVRALFSYHLSPKFNGTSLTDFGINSPTIKYSDHFYVAVANLSTNTILPPWIDSKYFYLPFTPINPDNQESYLQYDGITRGFGADLSCAPLPIGNETDALNFSLGEETLEFSTTHAQDDGSLFRCISYGQLNAVNRTTISSRVPPNSTAALEVMTSMVLDPELPGSRSNASTAANNAFCTSLVISGWIHLGAAPPTAKGSAPSITSRTLDVSFTLCKPNIRSALFNTTIDNQGHILSSTPISNFSTDISLFASGNETSDIFIQANRLIADSLPSAPISRWHNDTFTFDWLNHFLKLSLNSTTHIDPNASIPALSTLQPALEDIYSMLFAILLGLNREVFMPAPAGSSGVGFGYVNESRIFMSEVMFYTTVVLLLLNLLTAILYYFFRPRKFLPRMPTTIASVIGYVAASHALQDIQTASTGSCDKTGDGNEDMERERVDDLVNSQTYAFGRYIGVDGKAHVGIERSALVVPIETGLLGRETVDPGVRGRRPWGLWRKGGKKLQERHWI